MMRFIRLLGGGLGVILAISLAGFGGTTSEFFSASLEGRLLFGTWIAAWFVVGYAILPYITVVPARWLMTGVGELSTGEFVTAILGLLLGLLMGLLLGLPLANLPDPLRLAAAAGRLGRARAGHDGPDRGQAPGPAPGRP